MVWRSARPIAVVAIATVAVAGLAAPGFSAPGTGRDVHFGSHGEVDVNVCSNVVPAGYAHCDAHVRTDMPGASPFSGGVFRSHAAPGSGAYSPTYLQSAYNAPSATKGAGQTVAVVDAFDAPNAESDLAMYRSSFGLPGCTTANGCFRKVDQNGGTSYPAANSGWAQEISLDIDMVSALCPKCKILLVEASNASLTNLGLAVKRAVLLGANVVSNSYGGPEWSTESQADTAYFNHPGVAVVASTGDLGYGVNYPAASPDVVAVGGTTLFQSTNNGVRNATETVWSGAGSGCSLYEPKPAWQTDSGCAKRTVADVAAVADPNTGVWGYDGGWLIFGGTSVSAPIVSALYALAENTASSDNLSSYPYAHLTALNDVVSGSNGPCGGSYLCTGSVGYDGPTGLGTPNTADAFAPDAGPSLPAPDFALAATPISPMPLVTVAKSTVTATAQNGFSGSVHLSATVSPAIGLTPTFSAADVTVGASAGVSKLSLASHRTGVYTVTIHATSGALTHTTVLQVAVNDFSIALTPSSATVARGQQAHYTVTLTRGGSFNSPVVLAVTGLRAGDTVAYSHNPAPVSSAQTVTITTSKLDAPGALTVRITATSGSLRHAAVATLVLR